MTTSSHDVTVVCSLLGIDLQQVSPSGWAKASCPFHEDRRPSWSINLDDGRWVCRVYCGSGSLLSLVSRVLGVTLKEAWDWLARSNTHLRPYTAEDLILKLERAVDEERPASFTFDKARVPLFLVNRGFNLRELRRWGVGYDPDSGGAIFPYRDWYIKRNPDGVEPKYIYPTEMRKSTVLYGDEKVEGSPTVVVVEGPLDAIWMHQNGVRSTVALLGASLSLAQADKLNRRFDDVTLFLDNDPAGRVGTYNALQLIKTAAFVATLPPGIKDPPMASADQIVEALRKRIPAMAWILDYARVRETELQRVRREIDRPTERGLEEMLVRGNR